MHIAGLQKLTLLDYPGKTACTVFLSGCNLRCPFCHNASLVLPGRTPPVISEPELLAFLQKRRRLLDGVCITGGEPTLNQDLPQLLRAIRDLGYSVKLDTNGTQPRQLQALLQDSLVDYVAMDIKNSPEQYARTCGGIDVLAQAQESVRLLMTGTVPYEFRTTVVKPLHTPQDMVSIGRWLQGASAYYLQNFVDSGDLIGSGLQALSADETEALLQAVTPYIPRAQLRGSEK